MSGDRIAILLLLMVSADTRFQLHDKWGGISLYILAGLTALGMLLDYVLKKLKEKIAREELHV